MNNIVKMLEESTVANELKDQYKIATKHFDDDVAKYGSAAKAAAHTSSETDLDKLYHILKGYSLIFVDHADTWTDCYYAVDIFLGLTD